LLSSFFFFFVTVSSAQIGEKEQPTPVIVFTFNNSQLVNCPLTVPSSSTVDRKEIFSKTFTVHGKPSKSSMISSGFVKSVML